RARNVLVVANLALAVALTAGAGLFARSLLALENVEPGFEARGVLTATLALPETSFPGAAKRRAFQETLLERLSALPGVRAAALTQSLPLANQNSDTSVYIEGHPTEARDGRAHVWYSLVTPAYFDALRTHITEGRAFTAEDRSGNAAVAVVNEAFVRAYLDGERAVGRRLTRGGPAEGDWM